MDTQTKSKESKNLVFLHDSIRDYFAAEHIQNRWTKEEKKARRYVRKRRYNPVWQETIVFLSGLLENPDALLRTLDKVFHILTASYPSTSYPPSATRLIDQDCGTRKGSSFIFKLLSQAFREKRK